MGADALITIGLTGKYCAGKNYVASLFEERGISVIDVDRLGHAALEKSKDELIALFSRTIITREGTVDRKRLGDIVFSDSRALATLEGTVHPHMKQLCIEHIEQARTTGAAGVVINAALLNRMQLDILCDTVCFVKAPLLLRFMRAMRRDHATVTSFINMTKSQKDITPLEIRGVQNLYIIKNWGHSSFIHRQVDEFCGSMGL